MIGTVIDVSHLSNFMRSIPVTCPATVIGIPSPERHWCSICNQTKTAYKGFNPRPARSAAVIATGAPNPAAPSKMLQMKIQLK